MGGIAASAATAAGAGGIPGGPFTAAEAAKEGTGTGAGGSEANAIPWTLLE